MIRVGMRAEHVADAAVRCREDAVHVCRIVGTGIDHQVLRAESDDVGVRARSGQRAGIGGDQPLQVRREPQNAAGFGGREQVVRVSPDRHRFTPPAA
jgi:hypothetical protein